MWRRPRTIAIGNYDLRSSGTVQKSIEIATALAAAGLPSELWVVRAVGGLKARVPAQVPIVEVGSLTSSALGRLADLAGGVFPLAWALRQRVPAVFLSGGNHLHLAAKTAVALSGRRRTIRFGLRASNSSRRPIGPGGTQFSEPKSADRFKYQGADFVAAVSSALADEVAAFGGCARIGTIPNGVDMGRVHRLAADPFDHPFLDARRADGTRGPVLVSVGRLTHQKGFDLLIEALAALPAAVGARLLIVGEDGAGELAGLAQLAEERGVGDRIDFLGFLANPFAVMCKADLYVSASRWEGASNSLLEALACGLPLVATDCPTGNREILAEGRNGTLAPVEDPAGLAAAILAELAIDRDREGQRRAADAFDLQACLGQWVHLLGEQYRLATGESEWAPARTVFPAPRPRSGR